MIKTPDVLMSTAHRRLCSCRNLPWRRQERRCDLATTLWGLRRWWDGREGLDRGDLWHGWNRRDWLHRWERCDGWHRWDRRDGWDHGRSVGGGPHLFGAAYGHRD